MQLKNEEKDDDILLKIYSVIGMILGLERMDDMKYFKVRKEIMEDFLEVLERKMTHDCEYLSNLMVCLSLSGRKQRRIGGNIFGK